MAPVFFKFPSENRGQLPNRASTAARRIPFAALLLVVVAAMPARFATAQEFSNLDFDQAHVVPNHPTFGLLDWEMAVPGWDHSTGHDSHVVYFGAPHLGRTQFFLLNSYDLTPLGTPAPGGYSLSFISGHETSDPTSPLVTAFIAQSGLVPANAQSLHFNGLGNFSVLANGASLDLIPRSGACFVVDVSSLAGSVIQLKIQNEDLELPSLVTVDGFLFSTSPVPEPTALALWVAGGLVLLFRLRRS
jgi:hypothetical protein